MDTQDIQQSAQQSSQQSAPADQTNAPMVFDSTPVQAPAPAPSPSPAPAQVEMIFDSRPTATAIPVQAPNTTVAKPAQPQPQPQPAYSWSATPQVTSVAEQLENWAGNVQRDLMHGTDLTGIGAVLKHLGATGLEKGVSPEVAKFMGSLPLGSLQALQGASQLPQDGKRWEGTKNVAGGLLDAATMPSAFIAPEAGDITGEGIGKAADVVGDAAGSAAKAIKGKISYANIQPELQQELRAIFQQTAKDAGVVPKDAASIRDVAENVATAIEQKASGMYKTLDAATGGRVQRFEDALKNINRGIKESNGIDPETEQALQVRRQEVMDARDAALEAAKQAGVDPGLIDTANKLYRQAMSLSDLSNGLRMSVEGVPAQLAKAGTKASETVNVAKLLPRMNKLLDAGRLETALPTGNTLQRLYNAVQTSKEAAEGVHAVQTFAKWAAGLTGAASVYPGIQAVRHLFD